jgi:hypothetical protein
MVIERTRPAKRLIFTTLEPGQPLRHNLYPPLSYPGAGWSSDV